MEDYLCNSCCDFWRVSGGAQSFRAPPVCLGRQRHTLGTSAFAASNQGMSILLVQNAPQVIGYSRAIWRKTCELIYLGNRGAPQPWKFKHCVGYVCRLQTSWDFMHVVGSDAPKPLIL